MSAYENVVKGKLKLKGKALDVSGGGISKKKKKKYNINHHPPPVDFPTGGNKLAAAGFSDVVETHNIDGGEREEAVKLDDYLTPAERRYLTRREQIDCQRLAKMASKSHRDRIQEFNQYLANLTEHYDIPEVGPG